MNVVLTPVLVVLIGLCVRSRLIATLLYLVIEAILFTFQTLSVLLAWMAGEGGFGGAEAPPKPQWAAEPAAEGCA